MFCFLPAGKVPSLLLVNMAEPAAIETEVKETPVEKTGTTEATDPKKEAGDASASKTEAKEAADAKDEAADAKDETTDASDTKAESTENTEAKTGESEAPEPKGEGAADEATDAKKDGTEGSPLDQKIIRQIEYYFGDYNLPKDKFLQEHIKKDDGWISMEVMLNFQRLRKLSDDPVVICDALLKSSSKLMEVSDDKKKIRRSPEKPLPELSDARRQEIISRSAYAKGFPTEGTTLDMLLEFFAKFGATDNVQMRNWHDKVEDSWRFKGSVFVTFPTKEKAADFIKLESVKHGEKELIRKWQADYLEEKKVEMKEGKRGKDKRKKELMKAADGDDKSGENGAEKNGDDNKGNGEKHEHVYGAVLVLKGLSESATWTDVRDKLTEMGTEVAFVDFTPGDPEAFARLTETGSAKTVFDKMEDGKMEIGGVQVEARVLEGEEEQKYLDDQKEVRKNRRLSFKRRGGPARGRGRGRGAKRARH